MDDHEAVGRVFTEWTQTRAEEPYRLCFIWLYCYIRIYFLAKFASRPGALATEAETLIGDTLYSIRERMDSIEQPERFAHYVSVTCYRAFLSYWRKQKRIPRTDTLPDADVLEADPLPRWDAHDRALLRAALESALGSLPAFLQPVARLRLLEGKTYAMIEHELGTPTPTLRAYVHRVREQLQENEMLSELWLD